MSHYLAWGGEQGDEPTLLSLDDIAHGLRHGHYSGDEPYAHLAHIGIAGSEATLTPVDLRTRERVDDTRRHSLAPRLPARGRPRRRYRRGVVLRGDRGQWCRGGRGHPASPRPGRDQRSDQLLRPGWVVHPELLHRGTSGVFRPPARLLHERRV